jgi:integrase
MEWSAIDWQKRAITFIPKKTGRRKKKLVVPLHPELEKQLLGHPGVGDAPLFPTLAGRKTGGAHGLSAEFKKIMGEANIRGRVVRHTENGRANETKSFHSFRHSFTSALANAGIARETRQVLTGHASERMNELYTHREMETVREAIAVLPKL